MKPTTATFVIYDLKPRTEVVGYKASGRGLCPPMSLAESVVMKLE